MGDVSQARMARLYRPEIAIPAEKKAIDTVTIEVYNRVQVRCFAGDAIVWTCEAPSGSAARQIATALRVLQARRGTIF